MFRFSLIALALTLTACTGMQRNTASNQQKRWIATTGDDTQIIEGEGSALTANDFARMSLYEVAESVRAHYNGRAVLKKRYFRPGEGSPSDEFISEAQLVIWSHEQAFSPNFKLHGSDEVLSGSNSNCSWTDANGAYDYENRTTSNNIVCQYSDDGTGGDNKIRIRKEGARVTMTMENANGNPGSTPGYYVSRPRPIIQSMGGNQYDPNDGFACVSGEQSYTAQNIGGGGQEVDENGNYPSHILGCRRLIPLRSTSGDHSTFRFGFENLYVR